MAHYSSPTRELSVCFLTAHLHNLRQHHLRGWFTLLFLVYLTLLYGDDDQNSATTSSRSHMTLKASTDSGQSWDAGLVVWEGASVIIGHLSAAMRLP